MQQIKKATRTYRETDVVGHTEDPGPSPETQERNTKVKSELDTLLDEIDSVLEENAEEFVAQFVQKGGQ